MHGTLNALVNNALECVTYQRFYESCKQRDAASFLFPIHLLANTTQYKRERT